MLLIGDTMESKFNFFEIVKVTSILEKYKKIHGCEGVVLGKSQKENGSWNYAVGFSDNSWSIDEEGLETTGKFSSENEVYPGDHITVQVQRDGTGKIRDSEN